MASFPGSAVSFVQLANGTVTDAAQMNVAYNEIEAIQNVLLGNTAGTIHIGGTAIPCMFGVEGQDNVIQGLFRANSTQTTATFQVQASDGGIVLSLLNSTANDDTYLDLRTTAASKAASVVFYSESTGKWNVGKDATERFFIYDLADSSNVMLITTKGNVLLNSATDLGKELLSLQQDDADKAFIDFDGTTAANADNNLSTLTGGNTIQGFVKVEIEGSPYWMPYYDAPTE